jgi:hypothetical protein
VPGFNSPTLGRHKVSISGIVASSVAIDDIEGASDLGKDLLNSANSDSARATLDISDSQLMTGSIPAIQTYAGEFLLEDANLLLLALQARGIITVTP